MPLCLRVLPCILFILINPISSTPRSANKRSGDSSINRLRGSERVTESSSDGKRRKSIIAPYESPLPHRSRGIIPSSVPVDDPARVVGNPVAALRSNILRNAGRRRSVSLFARPLNGEDSFSPLMREPRPTKKPRDRSGSNGNEADDETVDSEREYSSVIASQNPATPVRAVPLRRNVRLPTMSPQSAGDINSSQMTPSTPPREGSQDPAYQSPVVGETIPVIDSDYTTPRQAFRPRKKKKNESPVSVIETGVSPIVSRLEIGNAPESLPPIELFRND